MNSDVGLLALSFIGAIVGAVLALIPSLHIFNLAGIAVLLSQNNRFDLAGDQLTFLLLGALVGWTVVNVIPSVFLFAPDDANANVVLPSTKLLLRGRGIEASLMIGAGSLGALVSLVALAPVFEPVFRSLRAILQPHFGWMLVAVIVFLVLGEWPRANDRDPSPIRRLASAWVYLGAGLLAFVLSGLLGFVLMYRSPVPTNVAFQNLLPAFVGLFSVPGLLQILFLGTKPPPQTSRLEVDLPLPLLLRGTLTGIAGGLFTGFLPVVTGGIGGLLAGHATAQRDDRLFLISQGASKIAYTVGSVLLLFVPGLTLTRGGLSSMLTTTFIPYGWRYYTLAVSAIGLCGAVAFVILLGLLRVTPSFLNRVNIKIVAVASLVVAVMTTFAFTNVGGVLTLLVATTVGLIPVLVGGRRLNCLGVILLPITLNMIGYGHVVAGWLRLL
jgi:putative membrane protein